MRRDLPLALLVTAAVASYPALSLAWCVGTLLGTQDTARELWSRGNPGAYAALVLVVTGAAAVGNAGRVLAQALWHTRRFRRWVTRKRIPMPGAAPGPHEGVRVRVVDVDVPLAVTAGLWRPYVVVSRELVATLSGPELRAVLAHEHAHARRRDPLRLLLGRVLAAHLWFLPLATDIRGRARRGYELSADRHAANRCGRAALASALLRVVSPPAGQALALAPFAEPAFLEARVTQLESGHAPRPSALSRYRAVLTAAGGLAFVATVAGAWAFMLLTCPCLGAVTG